MLWIFIFMITIVVVFIIYSEYRNNRMVIRYSEEREHRAALEEIVGISANSSFTSSCHSSEIRICDLKKLFEIICPIQIVINGKIVWDDNQNMDDWTQKDSVKFQEDYISIINQKDKIKKFTFYVVAFHHSVVVIDTLE